MVSCFSVMPRILPADFTPFEEGEGEGDGKGDGKGKPDDEGEDNTRKDARDESGGAPCKRPAEGISVVVEAEQQMGEGSPTGSDGGNHVEDGSPVKCHCRCGSDGATVDSDVVCEAEDADRCAEDAGEPREGVHVYAWMAPGTQVVIRSLTVYALLMGPLLVARIVYRSGLGMGGGPALSGYTCAVFCIMTVLALGCNVDVSRGGVEAQGTLWARGVVGYLTQLAAAAHDAFPEITDHRVADV